MTLLNLRVVHPDGSSTPVDTEFVGTEPRESNGEIYIIDVYEVTSVVNWNPGDHWEADEWPDVCSIRAHRVGVR